MAAGKFEVGMVYYQAGIAPEPEDVPVICTWIYEGFVHTPESNSGSCDVPHHFCLFKEYEGWFAESHLCAQASGIRLKIPSLEQAEESMLTWDELMSRIDELKKQISSGRIDG